MSVLSAYFDGNLYFDLKAVFICVVPSRQCFLAFNHSYAAFGNLVISGIYDIIFLIFFFALPPPSDFLNIFNWLILT